MNVRIARVVTSLRDLRVALQRQRDFASFILRNRNTHCLGPIFQPFPHFDANRAGRNVDFVLPPRIEEPSQIANGRLSDPIAERGIGRLACPLTCQCETRQVILLRVVVVAVRSHDVDAAKGRLVRAYRVIVNLRRPPTAGRFEN